MTKPDIMRIAEILGGAFRRPWPMPRQTAWLNALSDLPGEEVVRAAQEWARMREEEPKSPAALRQAVMVMRGNQRRASDSASRPMGAEELSRLLAQAERDVERWAALPPHKPGPCWDLPSPCTCAVSCPIDVQRVRCIASGYRCMYQAAWTKRDLPHVSLPELFFDLVVRDA